jgi:hypothetical protein
VPTKEEILRKFPYKYLGGGHFRDDRIPKGKTANTLHGKEVLEEFLNFLEKEKFLVQASS